MAKDEDDCESEAIPIVEDPDPHLRAWIRTLIPLLNELRGHDVDINPRVRFAVEQTQVAALERLRRMLASDLPATPTE
jgi:hypothetical protein